MAATHRIKAAFIGILTEVHGPRVSIDNLDQCNLDYCVEGLDHRVSAWESRSKKSDDKFKVFQQATEKSTRPAHTFIAGACLSIWVGVVLSLSRG